MSHRLKGLNALGGVTLVVVVLLYAGCAPQVALIPTPTPAPIVVDVVPLSISCPETMTAAIRAAASAFQRERPEFEVTVLTRADSLAMQALRQGDASVAVLGWLPEDVPDQAWVRAVARDGIAVVVNPQNGVPGLTMTQLQDLYRGRLEDWETWGGHPGPPQLVSRETASGDASFFQAWVMRDARVSLNALLAPSPEAVLQFVADDPLAVGYVSTTQVDGRVRALVVNDVPPTEETIAAGLYPLTRTLFVVTLTEPEGAAREFVQWLLAAPGQDILKSHGFVSPPEQAESGVRVESRREEAACAP